jgi:DNA-binding GntR family transcriptional regulator
VTKTSRYEQVATELRRRINAKHYVAELPSAGSLAEEFGVSQQTIQRALAVLDEQGLTAGRQGRSRIILSSGTTIRTRYERIAEQIRADVRSGRLLPGSQLPSELALMEASGVSRATVREALRMLEATGEITKHAGRRYIAGSHLRSELASDRLADTVRRRIVSGRYPLESRLPGENALAVEFNLSRPTIRAGLTLLETEGLIRAEPRRGWFVTSDNPSGKA